MPRAVASGVSGIGIILRTWYPERSSTLIFDESRGLVRARVYGKDEWRKVQHGALVTYELVEQGERIFVQNLNLIAFPDLWARKELSFLHHVLELCAVFIQPNGAERALFRHLCQWYEGVLFCENNEDADWERLIFLTRFFLLIGCYPDDDTYPTVRFIARNPQVDGEDRVAKRPVITRWLRECVALHPMSSKFKTVTFLEGGQTL